MSGQVFETPQLWWRTDDQVIEYLVWKNAALRVFSSGMPRVKYKSHGRGRGIGREEPLFTARCNHGTLEIRTHQWHNCVPVFTMKLKPDTWVKEEYLEELSYIVEDYLRLWSYASHPS